MVHLVFVLFFELYAFIMLTSTLVLGVVVDIVLYFWLDSVISENRSEVDTLYRWQ